MHVDDGRYFLQTTDERFDLITAEPPPPMSAGTVNLYTREYFQLLRSRLAYGGIAAYWLPLHALSDVSAKAILRGFCDAFDDCSLWHGSGPELMMIGTRGAKGPVSEEHFARQWRDPSVALEMKRLGLDRPEQLGALFIGDAEDIKSLVGAAPPLVDDDPKRIEAAPESREALSRLMQAVRDTSAARERFARSPLVAALWPQSMQRASLPYFDVQSAINMYMFGGQPDMPTLHTVLTRSPVTTPVLWPFGSSWEVQRLVTEASPSELSEPAMQFQLAVRLLAERSNAAAAEAFSRAERQPELREDAFGYLIYALCMAGQLVDAQRLIDERSARHDSASESPFWLWMRNTFGIVNDSR